MRASGTNYDGTELDDEELKQGIAKHAKCCTGTGIDPREAAVGVEKALAVRSETTAMGRVEVQCSALEGYFGKNAGAECVFHEIERIITADPANIITRAICQTT